MENIDDIQKITNLSLNEPLKLITIDNQKKNIYIKHCYLLSSKYNKLIELINKLNDDFTNYTQEIINVLKSSEILIWNKEKKKYIHLLPNMIKNIKHIGNIKIELTIPIKNNYNKNKFFYRSWIARK